MTRSRNLRRLIFIPWAISVALLCIGSLINFHQNRIWHKPLLPEFVATKRENEKILKNADLHFFSGKVLPVFSGPDALLSAAKQFTTTSEYVILPEGSFTFAVVPVAIGSNGLRAPPAS